MDERNPAGASPSGPPIVVGVLKDIHNLGIVVMKHALDRAGFRVVNAGAALAVEDFIAAAIETDARAILVSSSYGMAGIDAEGFRNKCIEAGLEHIVLYVGGNLTVAGQTRVWADIEAEFKALGFDRVYDQKVLPRQVVEDLRRDLGLAAG
jgi:methylaspartate mutase sigma subunit